MRVLILTLALGLGSGCGVLDELEAGNKILDQHADRSKAKKTEPEPEPEPPSAPLSVERRHGPSTMDKLVSWAEKRLEGPPPPPDPSDAMVRCWVGAHEHFTTKGDCQSRGGRGYELPPVK